MNAQAQKAIIIEQFKQINDENLIKAINGMLDYALNKEKQSYLIPEEQQKLVVDRFEEVRKNPGKLLDWDEVKKSLQSCEKVQNTNRSQSNG